jgi:hypothetical protein
MNNQNPMQQKPFEAASGPWANLSHTYCKQMDTAFKSAEPAMQALAHMQAEWAHLALARARAWASLPADISRCKSPADLAMLQFNFWQSAGRAYSQGWQRMLHAAAALAPQGLSAPAVEPRRDVITVPEMGHEPRNNRQAA